MTAVDGLGAYGFRLSGVETGSWWLTPQAVGAPHLDLVRVVAPFTPAPPVVTEREADVSLIEGVRLQASASSTTVTLTSPRSLDDAEVIHPFLAPAAALHWAWRGRETLHAGVVLTDAGALLILGDKEAGKSTTLAHLASEHGLAILSDDLAVVTEGLAVLAGPRSLDRRGEHAPDAGPASELKRVREDQRLRQTLGVAPAEAPVWGWVQLVWGPRLALTRLSAAERVSLLAQARRVRSLRGNPDTLLELIARPAYRLTRPRSLDSLASAGELLCEPDLLEQQSAASHPLAS